MSESRTITGSVCAYCGERRGHQRDHLLKSNQARRSVEVARQRENPKYIVPCCSFCNEAIGTRCFVPVSMAHLIPELEALTHSTYRVFDGKAETLREWVK